MIDLKNFWSALRDPVNGLWCDKLMLDDTAVCGDDEHRRYTSAGVGMGLISDAVFTELGLFNRSTGESRVNQTLQSLQRHWPKERTNGYYAHFVVGPDFKPPPIASTVDTAEMALGALFAANYFGGAVNQTAQLLVGNISWKAAIRNETVIGKIDFERGNSSGGFKPFNEYYTVAYLADLFSGSSTEPSSLYFDRYWGRTGKPSNQSGCPVYADAYGYELMTGGCSAAAAAPQLSHFVSSFGPLFNHYMTKGFHKNTYYSKVLIPNWRLADMAYWDSILNSTSEVWGHKAKGRLWGCGAGAGKIINATLSGLYGVDQIGNAMIASPHIMAGFLDGSNSSLAATIKGQLAWMRRTGACMYSKTLGDNRSAYVPWRCSIVDPHWRALFVDSIDFSTMVLGYASIFLPKGFYAQHAA